jgi:COMPASS component SWD1
VRLGEIVKKFNFDGPVWNSEFNPLNSDEFIVSLYDDLPKFIRLEANDIRTLQDSKVLVSTFHPDGDLIFTGDNKGVLSIISKSDFKVLFSQKFGNSSIKNIIISQNGRKLAINSSDRIIRQVSLPDFNNLKPELWELEVEHKYQDMVNRLQWNSILFNSNSEYLIASAFGSAHCIYVWETSVGSLIKILEGPKEELVDLEWNYKKCIICATGLDSGTVYVWSIVVPQKWSALAPDFVEIEENIDYQEQEDEFDIVPEDELNQKQLDEEDEVIDILTKEKKDARGSEMKPVISVPINFEEPKFSVDDL